jgi:hypothetical protein
MCSSVQQTFDGEGWSQWRSQLDKWGGEGDIFIYSCSALLISFEIDCFYGL